MEEYNFGEEYHKDRRIEDKHYIITNHLLTLFPGIKSSYELGCGLGFWVHCLRYYGVDACGTDISSYCVDNAFGKSKGMVKQDIPEGNFDLVLSMDVLEHLSKREIDLYINTLFDKSKKYIFVSVCSAEFWNVYDDPTHITKRPMFWWKRQFAIRGGTIVELPKDFLYGDQMFLVKVGGAS